MNRTLHRRLFAFAVTLAALGMSPGIPAFAQSSVDTEALANDDMRTGGCSGCFGAQMAAVLNTFQTLTGVVRGCGTGTAILAASVDNNCDGGALGPVDGDLLDFVVLRGNLKNSTLPASNGLGVPGGAIDVVYRVSANGSSEGIRAANTVNPEPTGFLAVHGRNGALGGGDDAGTGPDFGGADDGPDNVLGTGDDIAPALVNCDVNADGLFNTPGAPALPVDQECVVMFDVDNDLTIDNNARGIVTPFAGATETFNLSIDADTGYADLPPSDFLAASLNTQAFDQNIVQGAQVFKIIANNNVNVAGGSADKITLTDPQIELLFADETAGAQICDWAMVGGEAGATNDVTLCIRNPGSGTKEVFRNTFLRNDVGSATEATGSDVGQTGNCAIPLQGGGVVAGTKTVFSFATQNDVNNCVGTRPNSVGYVDAIDNPPGTHSVPVFGVDADAESDAGTLDDKVRCGQYPYWGPLAGGRASNAATSSRGGPITPFETAHRFALGSPQIQNESYIPFGSASLGGVGIRKNVTDGPALIAFSPTNCGQPLAKQSILPD